jgi:hypothetical protein
MSTMMEVCLVRPQRLLLLDARPMLEIFLLTKNIARLHLAGLIRGIIGLYFNRILPLSITIIIYLIKK